MDTSLIKIIEKQATHEISASMAYLAMSNWCASEDYSGFADFFKKQASEEMEHAEKFQKHLLERGVLPMITEIATPKCSYESILEVSKMALTLEETNTKNIVAAYEAADAVKDYPAKFMLQWFIEEQVEEEAWANSMVTHAERAQCAGALLNLDRHLEKIIEG